GAFFSVGDIRLGQGRENAKEYLRQNTDVADAIEAQIRAAVAPAVAAEDADDSVEDEEL
ncbi:MAG TPA: DNA recombination/repair protein RecA, partial [Ktedonobacterales bacterium]